MSDYDPDEATARADLYRFLSACYYEPEPVFIAENLFTSILIAAERLSPELARQARNLGQSFLDQDLQTLLVDYTRLFLGPVLAKAKPYGSSWLNTPATMDNNAPLSILDVYSEGGLEIDADFAELPDHVAVELEFLYLLTFNQNQAMDSDRADEVQRLQELKRRFLAQHLGQWFTPFAVAVKSEAETAFYRELAEFTETLLQLEAANLAVE